MTGPPEAVNEQDALLIQTAAELGQRFGLDYWSEVEIYRHLNIEALYDYIPESRFLYFTTKAKRAYTDIEYRAGDCLVFGRETRGLPEQLLQANWERCLTIPMPNANVRSLNLATSVGVVLYEALRQLGYLRFQI